MGLTQPSVNSLISRRAGGEEQGEVMGVSQSVASLSRVLGPFAAGFCFATFGRNAAFVGGAALVASALLLALKLPRLAVARPVEAGPLGREGGPA
jgi:MFS family permease